MELVNKTKIMSEAYNMYCNSNKDTLWKAYDHFSQNKAVAWDYCQHLCEDHGGYGLRIIGANKFKFSAGFMYNKDGKDYFAYITDCHDRTMAL